MCHILDFTYKWYHVAFVFLFLTSHSMIISRSIHVTWHYSFFFGWVAFHSVYVPHLLYPFTCLWNTGCFHILAIVNSAARNIGVHVSFWVRVFCGYMSRSGIAGSYGISIFSFISTVVHLWGALGCYRKSDCLRYRSGGSRFRLCH